MFRNILVIVSLAMICLPSFSAQAKARDDRLRELEKRVESIQQTYLVNNTNIASALVRSENVQKEFSALKGEVAANKHLLGRQRNKMMNMIRDLDHRLQAIEDRLSVFSLQIMSALKGVAPKVAKEGELYQNALDKLEAGEYLKAASVFQRFIKKYPRSTLAPKAQYWIGECFYSVKDFKRSIKEFQVVVKKYPRHEKVAGALLKQGHSFYELGMLDEAKLFLEKVIKDYPNRPEAEEAREKIGRIEQKKSAKTDLSSKTTYPENNFSSYPSRTIEQEMKNRKRERSESIRRRSEDKGTADEF